MEEIKSVRLRVNSSYGTDGKITISRVNNRKRIVTADRGVGNNLPELEFGNRYRDDSDDSIIENYLYIMNKNGQLPDDYEIIQNPWSDIVPKPRQYGFEPYYLNNGSSINIDWLDGTSHVGGTKWSDDEGNELDDIPDPEESKLFYTKRVSIRPNYESGDPPMMFTDINEIVKKDFNLPDKKFGGNVDDISIVESVIFYWISQTTNYDDLALCDPNNEFCNIIEYKSPINLNENDEEPEVEPTEEVIVEPIDNNIFTFNVEKEGSFIPMSTGTNSTTDSKIGELFIVEPGGFVFQDDFEQLDELDEEFTETSFEGLSEQEYIEQEKIANDIKDTEQQANLEQTNDGDVGDVVNIKPVGSFDELLRLAGKIARSIGLYDRVKYSNLNRGYVSGVHGLCPQGTQAVMYALLGITPKRLYGHADWYSFKSPGTDNGNASFAKTGYYKDKVQIHQKNGSWSGTYIKNSSQWQIGDILVMGYKGGKKYGHIQIWTGVKWMSDFKQNSINGLSSADKNTVALWRLNDKGVSAVKTQSGNIGKQIS
jgi:hypothetical protein